MDNNTFLKEIQLQELGTFHKGSGIPRDSANSGDLPAIRYGELYTDYNIIITGETRSKISNEIANDSFELQYGDVLLAGSGETHEDIGKSAVFLLEKGYAGGDIIVFRPDNSKVNPKYLALYFETDHWKRQRKKAAQGHSVVHIHTHDLKRMVVKLPDLKTQQRIIQILDTWMNAYHMVNKQITCETTIEYRTSQHISKDAFISNKTKQPISLFLKERKTFQKKSEGLPHVSLTKDGVIPKGERYNRDFLVKNDKEKKYKVTRKGDICYNPANLKFGVICRNNLYDGIFSPIYVTFDINHINPIYLEEILTSNEFIGRALRYEQGTVYERKAVSPEDLLRMKINVPDDKNQLKIAEITMARRKYVEKLKLLSEKYLQQYKYLLNRLINGDYNLSNIKLENGKEHK